MDWRARGAVGHGRHMPMVSTPDAAPTWWPAEQSASRRPSANRPLIGCPDTSRSGTRAALTGVHVHPGRGHTEGMPDDLDALKHPQPGDVELALAKAVTLAREARRWAWAQWYGSYDTTVVDPHAKTGPAAPPAWLTSGIPPWPHESVDTSAVPDQMLRTLLGTPDATPVELAEARRRLEGEGSEP